MQRFFQSLWYNSNLKPLACCLLPFSALYWGLSCSAYWIGKRRQQAAPIPIIAIGNLTTGGTGKTPVLIALTLFLQQQGFKVGIISRGYKSQAEHAKTATLITAMHNAQEIGDEPLLIFNKTHAPIAVNANRTLAIQTLLQAHPDLDLILSDDGLQNPKLPRDLELIVIDAVRGFGNGFLLPAGPLREPIRRLQQADFCISNGTNRDLSIRCIPFQFQPQALLPLNAACPPLKLDQIKQPIRAIAAIGHPERFFHTLRELGFVIIPHVFPDHHAFSRADFKGLENALMIMTEKDAVKCHDFNLTHAYALVMAGEFDAKFLHDFLCRIEYTIAQKKTNRKSLS